MSVDKFQTIILKNKPVITGNYSLVGPVEGKGPLGTYFHHILQEDKVSEKTFEKSERKILQHIIYGGIKSANLEPSSVQLLISGDLLNQIVSSSYSARTFETPFLGIYSACATMAEAIGLGAILADGKYFDNILCATVSHFSSAERQLRYPLELGNQRPPTSQWTVTGGGSTLISQKGKGPVVSSVTIGKILDYGIKDVNNMGAAMAPAAMSTIISHLKNTNTTPEDYDAIFTGDLGKLGSEILVDLLERENVSLGKNYSDCGCMIFNKEQQVFMGGSGCGCSASVLNSFILQKLKRGEYKKILLVCTGALLSPTTSFQGDTIAGIAHAVCIECPQQKLEPKTKSTSANKSAKRKVTNKGDNKNGN